MRVPLFEVLDAVAVIHRRSFHLGLAILFYRFLPFVSAVLEERFLFIALLWESSQVPFSDCYTLRV